MQVPISVSSINTTKAALLSFSKKIYYQTINAFQKQESIFIIIYLL